MKLKFSKTTLLAIEPPDLGKRLVVYDIEIPKLALRVTSSGSKTFYVVKRTGADIAWIKLGTFPDMTIENARKEATKALAEFTYGVNPAAIRREFKKEPTLSEFFITFGERHGKNKVTWESDQQRFTAYLEKPLGKKKLSEIDRAAIRDVIEDARKAGKAPGTQRQIRGLISTILGRAVEWDRLQYNPAMGVKVAGAVVKRDRFLLTDELPRFFQSLKEEQSIVMRDFILMAVLTGARRGNLIEMHWDDIDLKNATWRIDKTKNGEPQIVTLSRQAVELLKSRHKETKGGYVFAADSESGHISDPKQALVRVMKRAGIPYGRKVENGVTLHDLRRTLGSWQAMTGASLTIIGKSLNHKSQAATAIYARLENTLQSSPVRDSVNKATDAMFALADVEK
jgi:integrase